MRVKYLLIPLCVSFLFMGIVLLFSEKAQLKVITSPSIYSFKQTTKVETFRIPILMNLEDSIYTDIEFVSSVELIGVEEVIPLKLQDIVVGTEMYDYNNTSYYPVYFNCKVGFESNDYEIDIDQASIHVTYKNESEYTWYIGEFHYLFEEETTEDLLLGNYQATVFDHHDKKSVSGLHIELFNNSNSNITITNIEFPSLSVRLNNDYSIAYDEDIDMFEEVTNVLSKDYEMYQYQLDPKEHLVRIRNYTRIYIPASFNGDIHYLHRSYIIITYIIDSKECVLVIDDFPFISTSIFDKDYQSDFRYYEY